MCCTGPGSFMNVIGEAFKKEAGVDMTHIPFKEAVADAKHPDTVKRFADLAAEAVGSSAAGQDAIVRRQAAQFRPIIMAIKLE